ncbi:MAG TPA: phosphoribosylglycinamide synthetase C domain-containing protein [Rudaea sp.]|jgi:phosphoribosylamine--glycine ligase|nr:phosphoribosylglycinamide synthetase C domain-containing protein [Rudaea sp.]
MRFLGIGDYHSLGDMYWRLLRAGHEVRVFVGNAEAHDIFRGVVERVDDLSRGLDWVGRDGVIVCETATFGEQADALRADGFAVVGSSAVGDRLEIDRAFGQKVMADVGMQTAPTHPFERFDAAIDFVRRKPARYVYKLSDAESASTQNYVGMLDSGADMIAMLHAEAARCGDGAQPEFVLMDFLRGVEVGIGAYFDGEHFLGPACIDWEHKRFFPGDLGELTGEMGTVVNYRHSERLFERTLGRIAPLLRDARHHGYININTIVNDDGVFPLEFTSRFGYPGFAICDALHMDGWDVILRKMAFGKSDLFRTRDGFAVGVVLTVPPFPYEYGYAELSRGRPIFFDGIAMDDDALHFGEIERDGDRLLTSGAIGYVVVATGVGDTVQQAQSSAYATVRKVAVANARYRNDIGDRLVREDWATLERLRWIG